jgi:hypothetical protein
MTQDQIYGILMVLVAIVAACGGYGLCDLQWRRKAAEQIEKKRVSRREHKLLDTQENIAGRIYNAVRDGTRNNLQWGYRLKPQKILVNGANCIRVLDTGASAFSTRPTALNIVCSIIEYYGSDAVRVADGDLFFPVYTTDPNDPELTLFIGRQLDTIQNWKPEKIDI